MFGQVERRKRSLATLFYLDRRTGASMSLPPIKVQADGRVMAGAYELQPSAKNWRKRRVFWRALLNGKPVTTFVMTPRLAIATAERKSGLETVPPARGR
jgi:hypothetical protein